MVRTENIINFVSDLRNICVPVTLRDETRREIVNFLFFFIFDSAIGNEQDVTCPYTIDYKSPRFVSISLDETIFNVRR